MIGELPASVNVNGVERAIRSDYRVALIILSAYSDAELSNSEKIQIMLESLYDDLEAIPQEDLQEAINQAMGYLDGNSQDNGAKPQAKPVFDWGQDEQMIFSAVNKVAGCEIRMCDYLHWWTFLGYFNEIGEGLLSSVISIRQKKSSGKRLEKYEQEFYRKNKAIIDIKRKYTAEEQAEIDYLNRLLG